jgi:hypothetical protein
MSMAHGLACPPNPRQSLQLHTERRQVKDSFIPGAAAVDTLM